MEEETIAFLENRISILKELIEENTREINKPSIAGLSELYEYRGYLHESIRKDKEELNHLEVMLNITKIYDCMMKKTILILNQENQDNQDGSRR